MLRLWLCLLVAAPETCPPVAEAPAWLTALPWSRVVTLTELPGDSPAERLAVAQQRLVAAGGGVIYFPPGEYRFEQDVLLGEGIILRGADPVGPATALDDGYELPTKLVFPKYEPTFTGAGRPIETAFKGLYVENPATTTNCGLVNLEINRGHVKFGADEERRAGRNRFVLGCLLRNTASADPAVPRLEIGQEPWQRYTDRFCAAISVYTAENALVAGNRLPRSGDDNFVQPGYKLLDRQKNLVVWPALTFDYDNRPGIQVNYYGIGPGGGAGPAGTPEQFPWGFAKGLIIRDNYIYCSGRAAISFTGDGTLCRGNVIRFPRELLRPTVTGHQLCYGSSTNDNRAVEMRGWRWRVLDNDYEVYRNLSSDGKYYINDGEGLMHEAHVNSNIVDSQLIGNRGNSYLSLYRLKGIDGLEIRDNVIRTAGGIEAIYVVAMQGGRNDQIWYPCRRVVIEGNVTAGSGIRLEGDPCEGNRIGGNRHEGDGGKLTVVGAAEVVANEGYDVEIKARP